MRKLSPYFLTCLVAGLVIGVLAASNGEVAAHSTVRKANSILMTVPGDYPMIPIIDAAAKTRLQAIFADGQTRGRQADVFIKVGDSSTYSNEFLHGVGCDVAVLGNYRDLAPTITHFRQKAFPAEYADFPEEGTASYCPPTANAFNRVSAASGVGWTAADALKSVDTAKHPECTAGESALQCELRVLQPSIALIMFGTNNMWMVDNPSFRADIEDVVDATIAGGVIPVLSTIPPRLDLATGALLNSTVDAVNTVIITIAEERRIPLWNYWGALQGATIVHHGVKADGVHPNTYQSDYNVVNAVNFTSEGLRYGYNQRNLTALQILAELKRIVIDDGVPDDNTPWPTATVTPPAQPTPTPTPTNPAIKTVYDDYLAIPWQNWSWNTTYNPYNMAPVYGGEQSYAVTFTAAWAGFYLHADPGIERAAMTDLRFSLHGGDSGGQRFTVKLNKGPAVTVNAAAGWQTVTIPLRSLGDPPTISDLYWEENLGHAQATFYLDNIELINNAAAPTMGTPTPTAAAVLYLPQIRY